MIDDDLAIRLPGWRHAREPVEPLGVERRQAGNADRRDDAILQQRAACECMHASPGVAHHREPPNAQRIRDGRDVRRSRRDVTAGIRRRATVTRTVIIHPPDSQPIAIGEERARRFAQVWRAVVIEDRQWTIGLTGVVRVQRPSVGKLDVYFTQFARTQIMIKRSS